MVLYKLKHVVCIFAVVCNELMSVSQFVVDIMAKIVSLQSRVRKCGCEKVAISLLFYFLAVVFRKPYRQARDIHSLLKWSIAFVLCAYALINLRL